jgi:Zn-dependent protease with chaperone function/tetratricopeptide (TPR) repeat protein
MLALVALFFVISLVVTALAAHREGGGVARALLVGAFVAGSAAAPALVLAWVAGTWEVEPSELIVGGAVVLFVFTMGFRVVKQPFRHAMPMDDPDLEAALARVAQRAGLRTVPKLLRLRTLGALPVYGWVAVLHHPVVILADGLVHRLEPEEHEAILAHEVAHVSTGSLWWLQLPLPLAASISMAMLVWVDMWVVAGSTWALWAFLSRVIGRPTELLCDRRAAELTSPQAMISGLRKMHAVHPVRDPGWRWSVSWALATHPPAQLRVHALGEDQGPLARRLRWTSALGFGLWLTLYLAVLGSWTLLPGLDSFLIGVNLALLGLGLQLAPRLAARSFLRRRRALVPPGLPGRRWTRVGWWMFVFGFASILADWMGCWTPVLLLGGLLGMGLGAFRARGLRKLRSQLHEAMSAGKLAEARHIGQAHPGHLKRDPGLRHDVALANAALGCRGEAIEALERVLQRPERLPMAALSLGRMRLSDDPGRSLELGAWLTQHLPGEIAGPLLVCDALRRLRRPDEAMAAWAQARALEPDDPGVLILAIELALDADDADEAERWAEQARERAPGELTLQLAEARLALARGELETFHQQLDRARAILEDHPLAFVQWRIEELEAELTADDDTDPFGIPAEQPGEEPQA